MITEDVKKVVEGSPFLAVTTKSTKGEPHSIAVGKGEVCGDTVCLGIYKMAETQENIKANPEVQIVAAMLTNPPCGYRLCGQAEVKDKSVIVAVDKVEALL